MGSSAQDGVKIIHTHGGRLPWEFLIVLLVFALLIGSVGLVLAARESRQRRRKMAEEKKRENLSDNEVNSLEVWLKNWPNGPTWADDSGQCVPIAKTQLQSLIDDRNAWKKRAISHGCDPENGDGDCG